MKITATIETEPNEKNGRLEISRGYRYGAITLTYEGKTILVNADELIDAIQRVKK